MDAVERSLLAVLSERHARSGRTYRLMAVLLVLGGLATAAAGWVLPEQHGLPLVAIGILACALSVLPLLEAIERRERVEGLAVLAEDWDDIERKSEADETTQHELWRFLRRLYDKKEAGSAHVQ